MHMIPSGLTHMVMALALLLPSHPVQAQRKVVAYVPNWVDLNSFAETIDYAKLTHDLVAQLGCEGRTILAFRHP